MKLGDRVRFAGFVWKIVLINSAKGTVWIQALQGGHTHEVKAELLEEA